jgi:hypothetical protein
MAPRGASLATADHVIGVFSRDDLSAALAAVHRAGFGPQARVIDGARGDAVAQLRRASLRVEGETPLDPGALLIVVTAPGRSAMVSALFAQVGARSVLYAARRDEERPAESRPALLTPDIRIGDERGTADA